MLHHIWTAIRVAKAAAKVCMFIDRVQDTAEGRAIKNYIARKLSTDASKSPQNPSEEKQEDGPLADLAEAVRQDRILREGKRRA